VLQNEILISNLFHINIKVHIRIGSFVKIEDVLMSDKVETLKQEIDSGLNQAQFEYERGLFKNLHQQ